MSLKRILGIALASRMAGRGRRRRGLGAGMLGGAGYRRRPMMGGKAGLAALGYMAYKEYRNHQARTASQQGGTASGGSASAASAGGPTGTGSTSSGSGGIGDMVQGLIDKVTAVAGGAAARPGDKPAAESRQAGAGSTQSSATESAPTEPEPTEAELRDDERAAEQLSDEKALLLLRAMITAAYADGAMSTEERQGIMKHISEAGGDEEDRQVMEREIANPKSLDELLEGVHDRETAEQVYLASSAAVDGETGANRAYLENLRERLNLTTDEAQEIEDLTA